MSMFCVYVFGDNPEEQLNLYDKRLPTTTKAKWDAYRLGGRFENVLHLKDGTRATIAKLGDIDTDKTPIPLAILDNGKWRDKYELPLWDNATNRKLDNKWEQEVRKVFKKLSPDALVSVYECHI